MHGHRSLSRVVTGRTGRLAAVVALLTTTLAALTLSSADAAPEPSPTGLRAACAPAHGAYATCFARYRGARETAALRAAGARQLTPADIAAAYRLPADVQPSTTVAIISAFDNPKAERDLAVYRQRFGLPPCTTANGCFRKVNQRGAAGPLPEGDPGWGLETALDLDAVSAACPSCRVLLVEADDNRFVSLGKAVNTAVRLGATVVTNSYGGDEFNGIDVLAERYYDHPGVAVLASSGDFGFGIPQFPAIAPGVIAVGGTSLTKAPTSARGWTERVWGGAGSGCSGYVEKPSWQQDTRCPMRTSADVSAVADPDSGFLVYDTYGLGEDNGYLAVGGTSLSSPLIAGMIARAGDAAAYDTARPIYERSGSFFDVVGGRNGFCGGDYLCTGRPGYDGPSGVGTPNGLSGLSGR